MNGHNLENSCPNCNNSTPLEQTEAYDPNHQGTHSCDGRCLKPLKETESLKCPHWKDFGTCNICKQSTKDIDHVCTGCFNGERQDISNTVSESSFMQRFKMKAWDLGFSGEDKLNELAEWVLDGSGEVMSDQEWEERFRIEFTTRGIELVTTHPNKLIRFFRIELEAQKHSIMDSMSKETATLLDKARKEATDKAFEISDKFLNDTKDIYRKRIKEARKEERELIIQTIENQKTLHAHFTQTCEEFDPIVSQIVTSLRKEN